MKKKNSLIMLLSITLILGILGTLGPTVFSSPAVTVEVVPIQTDWAEPGQSIGDTFTVGINVTGLDGETYGLNTWTAGLKWDPTKLEVVSASLGDVYAYALLVNPTCTQVMPSVGTWNNTLGEWIVAAGEGISDAVEIQPPSVELLSVTFKALDYVWPGYTNITFPSGMVTLYSNVAHGPYAFHTTAIFNDGQFRFQPTTNVAPTADFSWTPTYPTAGLQNATFTATASDPDGVGIENMTLNFGSGAATPTSAFQSDPVTLPWILDVNYTAAGTFTVTLTVWDKGKPPYYGPDSVTVTKNITVVPPAPPSGVDVFTIKEWLGNTTLYRERGTGPLAAGSAFAPGETVTLRGYAYYMDIPMMAINVGFQVNDPGTNPYASRASSTDSDGNATVSLRLPMVPAHGSYGVVATCRIFETDMSDTLEFNVGWLVSISVAAPTTVDRGAVGDFTVTVTNIDPYDAYPVVLTISVWDLIDQNLGVDSLETWAAVGTADEYLSVTIPGTAMPGLGADVEANAYTDWPENGGTAYCPSDTEIFTIA